MQDAIARHHRFLLTSHIFPEGDSLGSEVALALHLRDRGKAVSVLNPTPARDCYGFLLDLFPVHHLYENGAKPIPPGTELVIALDVAQWDYVGPLGAILRESRLPILAVDHHHAGPDFADWDLVDPTASSTGEMLYDYLRWAGERISPEIAQALYASILFDTGGLRLPQTSNRTVMIASDLLTCGADHGSVIRTIFQSESLPRVELYRRALERLRYEPGCRLAWISIPASVFGETATDIHDADGVLDNLLSVREIELCALFREVPGGAGIRVTFRSKGSPDVGAIATRLGGGGRRTAAGLFMQGSLEEAEGAILPILRAHESARAEWLLVAPLRG